MQGEIWAGHLWAALFRALMSSGVPVTRGLHKPSCWRLGLDPSPSRGREGRRVGEIKQPRGKGLVGSSLQQEAGAAKQVLQLGDGLKISQPSQDFTLSPHNARRH